MARLALSWKYCRYWRVTNVGHATFVIPSFAHFVLWATPISPPSGLHMSFLNGLHPKSNFLAIYAARLPLDIPVKGAGTLSLIVTPGDDTNGSDHAIWADAYLTK